MQDGAMVEEGNTADLWQSPGADYTRQLLEAIPRFEPAGKHPT